MARTQFWAQEESDSLQVRHKMTDHFVEFVVSLLLLVSAVSFAQQETTAPDMYRDPDAYAIYSLVLPLNEPWQGKSLVIQEATGIDPHFWPPEKCITLRGGEKIKFQPAMDDFSRFNSKQWKLLPMLTLAKPYSIAPNGDIAKFDVKADGGGALWRQKYPGAFGYIYLSAVGFNRDRTRAIVTVGYMCGNVCGGNTYYFLKKNQGKWEIVPLEQSAYCTLMY
ncbi:MAG TPA: hypothetical protein VKB58_07620 [Terriglobales bacterium]|nr:hypothetical protein [Terriglobales bacterium]